MTYPHSRVQSTSNLIVLLEPGTAPKNLGKPELRNGTLHVANLALLGRWSLHPLRRLPADTTDHVRMSKGLGSALLRFGAQLARNRLGNAGMEGRGAARDDEVGVLLITGDRTSVAVITVAGSRTGEGSVGC